MNLETKERPDSRGAAGYIMQSYRMSLVEATANVAVGYALALLTQIIVFPLFGVQAALGDNLAIGAIFTGVSLARSFALRRLFEAIRVRKSARAGPRAS